MDPINPIAGNPEALNQVEPVVQNQPSSHLNNITIFSMAAFVLLSLGVVAFLYYQNQQLKGMLAKYQTPIGSPEPSAQAATPDPTTNWKTYTDPKGVYSFKYPDDWKLTLNLANGHQIILLDKIDTTQPKVTLTDGSEKDASYEMNFSLPDNNVVIPSNAEKYTVSGIVGSKYSEGCGGCSGASTFVVVKNNNLTYSFSYGAQANLNTHTKYLAVFDQILSTLKFLGQNQIDTSNWRTYTNNTGFSIKYPQSLSIVQSSQFGTPEANLNTINGFIYDPKGQNPPGENYYINFDIGDTEPKYTTELQSSESTVLDGQTVKKITLNTISSIIYSVKLNNGKFVQIYVSGDSSKNKLANQILSTFKFTN